MDQTTLVDENIIYSNAPQFNTPTKIIAEDVKTHATVKARANSSIDVLMNDIYQSTPNRRADLSKSTLDALEERIRDYRIIGDCVQNLEAFVAEWNVKSQNSTSRTDYERVTLSVALKMLGLLTSSHISHEFRMASLVRYPMPVKVGADFDSTISAYGAAMEPYWVEVEMLVQKYHISVDSTVSDTKPWWKLW